MGTISTALKSRKRLLMAAKTFGLVKKTCAKEARDCVTKETDLPATVMSHFLARDDKPCTGQSMGKAHHETFILRLP